MRLLLALLLAAPVGAAEALQVNMLTVSRDDTVYHLLVDVLIDAPPARVRERLLDVSVLPQLDPSITAARATEETGGRRIEAELKNCLFGICRKLLHVQRVKTRGNEITAVTLPVAGSSFKSGVARWQLTSEGQGTRLLFSADTEPDLWLPPFIGPRVLMHRLREKTLASLMTLERLARD